MDASDKLFSRDSLLLIPFGILVNYALAKLVLLARLPIFLDSIGTLFAAALGGLLPGIAVGFFSNALNSIGDPITLYYGLLSVIFGILAAAFSRRGVFLRFGKTLLSALAFTFVGGVLGSVLTWMLYGLDIGAGISSPFAMQLHAQLGMSKFFAQLSADLVIDLIDKLCTVIIVFFLLRWTPKKLLAQVPLGDIYLNRGDAT